MQWSGRVAASQRNGAAAPQVLADSITFYLAKADEVLKAITDARAQGIAVSEFGKEMSKLVEYKELANHAAERLAPYLHPRLAAVEVKAEQTQPFVIVVPKVETDSERWACAANSAKLITSSSDSSSSNGSGK